MFSILTSARTLDRSGKMAKTIGYYLSFIALGASALSLGPTLPDLARNTNVDLDEFGFLLSISAAGYLIGSLFSGRVFDRFDGHPVFVGALVFIAIGLFLIPLINHYWLLGLILFILSLAKSSIDVGGNALLVWVHGTGVRPFMNLLHFCFGVGATIAPFVMTQSRRFTEDIIAGYWVLAGLMLLVAVYMLMLPSPAIRKESEDESFVPINYPFFLLLALFFFLFVGLEMGFGEWIYTYATEKEIMTETNAGYLNSVFWGVFTAGRLLTVPIAHRFRPRTILIWNAFGAVASVTLILVWSNNIALWIGTAGFGLSIAASFPTLMNFAENHMSVTGEIAGGFLVAASISGMVTPPTISNLIERVGPESLMWFMLAEALIALTLFIAIIMHLRSKATE